MPKIQTPQDAEIAKLRKALDQILNGTLLDEHNHDDDGLLDFNKYREVTSTALKNWCTLAQDALKGA